MNTPSNYHKQCNYWIKSIWNKFYIFSRNNCILCSDSNCDEENNILFAYNCTLCSHTLCSFSNCEDYNDILVAITAQYVVIPIFRMIYDILY